jgi:hypothetical protein
MIAGISFATAFLASAFIIILTEVIKRIYISNVRSAFQNAFLPKTFMPPKIKAIKLPHGLQM